MRFHSGVRGIIDQIRGVALSIITAEKKNTNTYVVS